MHARTRSRIFACTHTGSRPVQVQAHEVEKRRGLEEGDNEGMQASLSKEEESAERQVAVLTVTSFCNLYRTD